MANDFNPQRQTGSDRQTSVSSILTLDREQPHNSQAEMAVLGAMLLSADAASTAMERLNFPGAFYHQANQTIFDAMVALNPKGSAGMDPVVLADYLRKNDQLDAVGGPSYLALLMEKTPTTAFIDSYVEIVKQTATVRRIISTCSETILQCYENEGDAVPLMDRIQQQILEISQLNQRQDYQPIQPLVDQAMEHIRKLMEQSDTDSLGIPTGYDILDRSMTGGLQPGMLFVLAARPSIGKTALALNMAYNVAMKGIPVGIFSLEMTAESLTLRMISSGARVNITKLAYQKEQVMGELQKVVETSKALAHCQIYIDETGGIDILELRSKARRMYERHHIKALFIDYLQLITINTGNRNANRENDVARISGSLKALAKELQIPIVVLCQVNRAAEQGDGQPKLSNLRESGAIEQDADVVAILHRNRDEQYAQDADQSAAGLDAVLLIAKNRNGRTGKQNLTFFPQYTRFDGREETVEAEDIPAGK